MRPFPTAVRCFRVLLAVCFLAVTISDSYAQRSRRAAPTLVRDAEIEALIQDYTTPIFKAAGLSRGAVDIYLLNDERFNAFVTGRKMFVNTGALVIAESPNEIIGVLAHETGHVVGGHLARLRDRVDRANVLAVMSMLIGAGAAVFGGEAGGAAGQALAFGSQSTILRDLLAYQRSEEAAADNMAHRFLEQTGQSTKGMLKTFDRFAQDSLFSGRQVDPYLRSHPMPRDRIALLQTLATKSQFYEKGDPPELQLRHDMARAKILAYGGNGGRLASVFRDNPQGPAPRYGLAIAMFLRGSNQQALPIIDRLIEEQPSNPYLHEMRAEMLLKAGRAGLAVPSIRKAISLDRKETGLLRILLGHALLESGNSGEAIQQIKAGLARDPTGARGYGLLARGYASLGEPDLARAAAAEEAFYQFRFQDAKNLAHAAQPKLKRGSPQWLRLQDIIEYKPPKKNG